MSAVESLSPLMQRGLLWRGRGNPSAAERLLPSGHAGLDALLGGGWPRAALVELLLDARIGRPGLSLLLPLLASLGRDRWLGWIGPPFRPHAPALQAAGLDLSRLLLIRDLTPKQQLWALEQVLRSGTCGAVLAWPERLSTAQLRRLQLAAEQGDSCGLLFRPARAGREHSVAALRLTVRPAPDGLVLQLLKRRGGMPAGERLLLPRSSDEPVDRPLPA